MFLLSKFSRESLPKESESVCKVSRSGILFVAPTAYRLTGLGTWLDYLIPGLLERGWDVTLGLVEGPKHHRPSDYLIEHPAENWLAIPCQTGTPWGRRRVMQQIIHRVKPDLVVSVNVPDALVAAATLAPRRSVRSVMTCHGIQADLFGDLEGLRRHIDAVVCTNQLGCELARQFAGMEEARVFYAPYGTKSCELRDTKFASRPTFGYIGRLEQPQKRLHDVIAVIRRLANRDVDCDWILAGTGPLESVVRYELEGEISSGHVTVTGHVSASDLEESVYTKMDALLITSAWETGPLVAWEAMSRGINVVSSRYIGSGLERALRHGENSLLFDIGDTETAAAHLETLSTQFPVAKELGYQAHVTVNSRYSCESSIQQWDDTLRAISSLPLRAQPTDARNGFLKSKTCGRLNRIFGDHLAESIRHLLQRPLQDHGPAGEWPHSLGCPAIANAEFVALAEALDRRETTDATPPPDCSAST